MTYIGFIITEVALILGVVVGWIACEKFIQFRDATRHDFEDLFEENPHPELFDSDGNIDRGEYLSITFDPGYDPDEWDPEDLHEGGVWLSLFFVLQ